MTLQERIDNYHAVTKFPESLFIGGDGRLQGMWIMGNNYRGSGSYGSYPHGFLKRVDALFPDRSRVLHLFSGNVDTNIFPGDTVDIDDQYEPTYVDDCQSLDYVPLQNYDFFLADPPYSVEDAEHYKTTMIHRNKVMRALGDFCNPGAIVLWLDQVLPMYKKLQWEMFGIIGLVKSTNHRFRVLTMFRRTENDH